MTLLNGHKRCLELTVAISHSEKRKNISPKEFVTSILDFGSGHTSFKGSQMRRMLWDDVVVRIYPCEPAAIGW
jgi:hypothetical protein